MKSSINHLPDRKRRELDRAVAIILEEFEDALGPGTAEFKKKGRVLKIILFGSYARGEWVDEPHTMKGYRSDYDLLIVVNNRKLTDFAAYWYKAADRLLRDRGIDTPVSFIVHSRREVNTALREGQYFFSDIRRDGIVLYELDEEPLAEVRPLTPVDEYSAAKEHFTKRFSAVQRSIDTAKFQAARAKNDVDWRKDAAFALHQAIERSYSVALLTLTNYGPPSHNLNFLRSLAEGRDNRIAAAWPRDQQRYKAWFNTINEAYVKARYSEHYDLSEEALKWLIDQANVLKQCIEQICREHIERLGRIAGVK